MISKLCGPLLGNLIFRYLVTPQLYEWMEEQLLGFLDGVPDLSALFAENGEFEQLLHRFGAMHLYESLKARYGNVTAGSEESVAELIESVAAPWAERLSDAIGAVIVFVLAFLVLGLLLRCVIACVERAEVLNVIDRFFGFLLGLISGAYSTVVFCYVVYFVLGVLLFLGRSPEILVRMIDESAFFGRLYAFVTGAV